MRRIVLSLGLTAMIASGSAIAQVQVSACEFDDGSPVVYGPGGGGGTALEECQNDFCQFLFDWRAEVQSDPTMTNDNGLTLVPSIDTAQGGAAVQLSFAGLPATRPGDVVFDGRFVKSERSCQMELRQRLDPLNVNPIQQSVLRLLPGGLAASWKKFLKDDSPFGGYGTVMIELDPRPAPPPPPAP